MDPRQLQNNDELLDYLAWLSKELKAKGKSEIADEVNLASRFSVGSPSEFLHETQQVLRKVRATCSPELTLTQLGDVASVIEQIEVAFKKVGGA